MKLITYYCEFLPLDRAVFATVESGASVLPEISYPFHLQSHSSVCHTPGLWHPCIILLIVLLAKHPGTVISLA